MLPRCLVTVMVGWAGGFKWGEGVSVENISQSDHIDTMSTHSSINSFWINEHHPTPKLGYIPK